MHSSMGGKYMHRQTPSCPLRSEIWWQPANMKCRNNVGLMLGQRRRRCPNIKPTLVENLAPAGVSTPFISTTHFRNDHVGEPPWSVGWAWCPVDRWMLQGGFSCGWRPWIRCRLFLTVPDQRSTQSPRG